MVECYSKNATAGQGEAVAWNNTVLKKGCTVDVSGASIQFNKCGIYEVSVNASSTASVTLQLYKSGVAQPQAAATGEQIAFSTLVQVPENNSCCPCASPTVCNLVNVGSASATLDTVGLIVTKLV